MYISFRFLTMDFIYVQLFDPCKSLVSTDDLNSYTFWVSAILDFQIAFVFDRIAMSWTAPSICLFVRCSIMIPDMKKLNDLDCHI